MLSTTGFGSTCHGRLSIDATRFALMQVVHEVAGTIGLQQPIGALFPLAEPLDVEQRRTSVPGRL